MKKMKKRMNELIIGIGFQIIWVIFLLFIISKFILTGLDFTKFIPTEPMTLEQLTRFIFILVGLDFIIVAGIFCLLLGNFLGGIYENVREFLRLKKRFEHDKV